MPNCLPICPRSATTWERAAVAGVGLKREAIDQVPHATSAPLFPFRGMPLCEPGFKLRPNATIRNLITRIRLWLGKLFSLAFVRVLMIFLLGFAAS